MAGLSQSDQKLYDSAKEKRKNVFYNPASSVVTRKEGITGKGNSKDSTNRLLTWYNANKEDDQSTLSSFFDTYGNDGYTKDEIMGL